MTNQHASHRNSLKNTFQESEYRQASDAMPITITKFHIGQDPNNKTKAQNG